MPKYTALAADGSALATASSGHQAVQVEHELLAASIVVTAFRSPEPMTWLQAKAWAESLTTNGRKWRLPTVEEAFLICDRTKIDPVLPVEFFPDCEGEWIWTATPDAEDPPSEDDDNPAGYAWFVYLYDGSSLRTNQGLRNHARAVCAGQDL